MRVKRRGRLFLLVGATVLAIGLLSATLGSLRAAIPPLPPETAYLPVVLRSQPPAPTGSYDCLEYEFGLVWTTEVITLSADGRSVYAYGPPYGGTVSGTWAYDPALEEVQFTNFRWLTATYLAPDRLWSSRYLPGPDFEIALSCRRR